jgi:hypothetical protein
MSAALHGNSQLVTISFVMNNGPKMLNLRVRLLRKRQYAPEFQSNFLLDRLGMGSYKLPHEQAFDR